MPSSVNDVFLLGHLGGDARTRTTAGGREVSTFRLATTRVARDPSGETTKRTEWHNVTVWGGGGVTRLLRSGARVHVHGRLRTSQWEAEDGSTRSRTEVVLDAARLVFLSPGRDRPAAG